MRHTYTGVQKMDKPLLDSYFLCKWKNIAINNIFQFSKIRLELIAGSSHYEYQTQNEPLEIQKSSFEDLFIWGSFILPIGLNKHDISELKSEKLLETFERNSTHAMLFDCALLFDLSTLLSLFVWHIIITNNFANLVQWLIIYIW